MESQRARAGQARIPQEGGLGFIKPTQGWDLLHPLGWGWVLEAWLWDAEQVGWQGRHGLEHMREECAPSRAWTGLHVPEAPLARKAALSPRWHVTATVWGGQLLRF